MRRRFVTAQTSNGLARSTRHPPGAKLAANGLPVFTLDYANDDDGERKIGADSRLRFTAPGDGAYLIRVTEARGFSGDRFVYRLVVREPKPDFKVALNGANPTVNAGSGQSFSVTVDRMDGFDGRCSGKRHGHEDLVTFFVENLPHGVIVDNIGLGREISNRGAGIRACEF